MPGAGSANKRSVSYLHHVKEILTFNSKILRISWYIYTLIILLGRDINSYSVKIMNKGERGKSIKMK